MFDLSWSWTKGCPLGWGLCSSLQPATDLKLFMHLNDWGQAAQNTSLLGKPLLQRWRCFSIMDFPNGFCWKPAGLPTCIHIWVCWAAAGTQSWVLGSLCGWWGWFAPFTQHSPSSISSTWTIIRMDQGKPLLNQNYGKDVLGAWQTAGCCIFFIISSESIQLVVERKIIFIYLWSLMMK